MDDRLQAYLDGELPLAQLPEELRGEAESWDELLDRVRHTAPAGAPMGLDARVRSAVAGAGAHDRSNWLDWLLTPRLVPVPPAAVCAAAAIVMLLLLPYTFWRSEDVADLQVYVQFVVDAPSAETVHLAGDFNDWQPTVSLEDADGDGVWSGRVALKPGVHEYMFVIDGDDWMTDPNATSYQDDGFGQRNAVVAVSPLNET